MIQKRFFHYFVMLIVLLSISLILFSCSKDDNNPVTPEEGEYPSLNFAVFSDPHYYDATLGTTSEAFQTYLAHDRKMLAESKATLEAVVNDLKAADVEVVLVPGDLTKDGEKVCHEQIAAYLAQIEASGKKVYVIPGNHDIQNSASMSYPDNSDPVPIPSVTPDEFKTIYNDFGYAEAIDNDPNSLSYVAQPKDSIWILGIDDCNYNGKYSQISWVGGDLKPESVTWIKSKLQEAKSKGITVFTMMHHGLVEHFPSMEAVFPEYLISDWQNKAKDFAAAGMNLIFTGHHHANDISKLVDGNNFLIDIQTGSLVSYPVPYRLLNFDGNEKTLKVTSVFVSNINYDTGGMDFQSYAKNSLASGFPPLVVATLMSLGVDSTSAQQLEPLVTPTLIAYYHGDEPNYQDPTIMAGINSLITSGDPTAFQFGMLLTGVWNDLTWDNNVTIDLKTGDIAINSGGAMMVFK